MTAESQSADADTDEEASDDEFTYYPQVTQHPTTIIEGDIVDIKGGNDIDADIEQTGSSFGVVYENPTVENGSIWMNRDIPEGFSTISEFNDSLRLAIEGDDNNYVRGQEVTDESIEAAQERLDEAGVDYEDAEYDDLSVSGTDFKVADTSDRDAEVQEVDGTVLGVDVGGGVFSSEKVDGFSSERIMVWYGGMSGQFVGRALDFNGMPFARYTDDGYLLKGLFQVPIGWRGDADIEQFGDVPTTDRSKLATDYGRKPRAVRPPLLREDIGGRAFVAIGRYMGGNMHEVHVGRAQDDYSGLLEALANDEEPDDIDELDMKYDQSPEERLAAEFDNPEEAIALYHGEGWQSKPDNAEPFGGGDDGGGSFDIEADVSDDDVEHPTPDETEFAQKVSEQIAGTGASPDDAIFPVGDDEKADLAGLVQANTGNFEVDPDVDAIRREVYDNTDHLDVATLDE